jgi:hypothetical protein
VERRGRAVEPTPFLLTVAVEIAGEADVVGGDVEAHRGRARRLRAVRDRVRELVATEIPGGAAIDVTLRHRVQRAVLRRGHDRDAIVGHRSRDAVVGQEQGGGDRERLVLHRDQEVVLRCQRLARRHERRQQEDEDGQSALHVGLLLNSP